MLTKSLKKYHTTLEHRVIYKHLDILMSMLLTSTRGERIENQSFRRIIVENSLHTSQKEDLQPVVFDS